MPGKVDHRTGGGGNMLDNVFLQYRVGHAKRLIFWIEVFLLQVVAIMTVQVADGANGLDKNLKFAGSFNHRSISNLQSECPNAPDWIRTRFFWSDYKWDNPCGSRKRENQSSIIANQLFFCVPSACHVIGSRQQQLHPMFHE
jgi:hypothetical protein